MARYEQYRDQDGKAHLVGLGENGLYEVPINQYQCVRCGAEIIPPAPGPPQICDPDQGGCGRKSSSTRFELLTKDEEEELWEPYPEPEELDLELDLLWEEITEFISDHLVMPAPEDYHVLTAWIIATYKQESFDTAPYLHFVGPINSGKTRALEILNLLAYKAVFVTGITAPAVPRIIELYRPTLLVDQAERIFRSNDGDAMYRIFASGYRRGPRYVVADTEDPTKVIVRDVFGFKALDSTNVFDEALTSRSILFRMKEGKPKKLRISADDKEQAQKFRAKLLYYALMPDPPAVTLPSDLNGRIGEIYEPLLRVEEHFGDNAHSILLKRARESEKALKSRMKDTMAAQVLQAIYDLSSEEMERSYILLSDVSERTGLSPRRVGYVLRDLGIEKIHTKHGRAVPLSDEKTVSDLQYLFKKFSIVQDQELIDWASNHYSRTLESFMEG